jgi:hypothetical protein
MAADIDDKKDQPLIEQGDHTQIQMGFKGKNIESGIQLRESQQRIILILNSSIKQKDEQQTRLFAEARVGFQRDCRTQCRVRRLRPIITQIGSKKPEFLKQRASLSAKERGAFLFS